MQCIVQAANILDTSEYEVLRRGYIDWHGSPPAPETLQQAFRDYFQHDDPPLWGRHYARKIVFEFERQESARVTTMRLLATLLGRGRAHGEGRFRLGA